MNCCNKNSAQEINKGKRKKISWKTLLVIIFILALLILSSLSIKYH